jgi:hypothetical protein
MNEEKLEAYANIKKQIKELEVAEKALKAEVLDEILKAGEKHVVRPYGQFTKCVRKTSWKYSSDLTEALEDIDIKKLDEQESGVAKCKETEYITFK